MHNFLSSLLVVVVFWPSTPTLLGQSLGPSDPANAVAECLEISACASVLARASAEVDSPSDEHFTHIGLRLALAMAILRWRTDDWVACVEATEDGLAAVREVHRVVVASTECELGEVEPRRERWLHAATGRGARILVLSQVPALPGRPPIVRLSETLFQVHLYVTAGPRNGAAFRCDVALTEGVWAARSCRLVGVS